MPILTTLRRTLAENPRAALADALGLAALCLFIFAGFTVPAVL
ncbi:MAG: hypothetical protein ACFBSD_02230 [Paracoccaceae bacterium]